MMSRVKFSQKFVQSPLAEMMCKETPVCVELFVSNTMDADGLMLGVPYLWMACCYDETVYGRDIHTLYQFLDDCCTSGLRYIYTFEPRDILDFVTSKYDMTGHSLKSHDGDIVKFSVSVGCHEIEVRSIKAISGANTIEDFVGIKPILNRRAMTPKTDLRSTGDMYLISKIVETEERYIVSMRDMYGSVKYIPKTLSGIIKRDLELSCFGENDSRRNSYQGKLGKFDKPMSRLPIIDKTHFYFLRSCFLGGYIGFNNDRVDKTIESVMCYDITSAHIASLIAFKYPVSLFGVYEKVTEDVARRFFAKGYLGLLQLRIKNLKSIHCCRTLKAGEPADDIDMSHGFKIVAGYKGKFVKDSDRGIVSADDIIINITSTLYQTIRWFYSMDSVEVLRLEVYNADYLPVDYTRQVLQLFKDKSYNKGNPDAFMESVTKKKVNITYGLLASGFWTTGYDVIDGKFVKRSFEVDNIISNYNSCDWRFKRRTGCYQWAIFCTSYTQYCLFTLISKLGDRWLYSDTDCIYFVKSADIDELIKKYNIWITNLLLASPAVDGVDDIHVRSKFVDKTYCLGHMLLDGDYKRFKYIKPKTYLGERVDGGYKLVIAGCSNFNKDFFKTVEPFEWFTMSGNSSVPLEYCDSYNEYVTFGRYSGVVLDHRGVPCELTIPGGSYKVFTDYILKRTKEQRAKDYASLLGGN